MSFLSPWIEKSYVPIVSLGLVFAIAHYFPRAFDPQLDAQNSRIRFQTGDESVANSEGLKTAEIDLAKSVLNKSKVADQNHTEILYVGNSQSMAIMDQAPGDMISPQWLQVLLARQQAAEQNRDGRKSTESKPVVVTVGSLPNISTPEILVQLVAARESSPRRVSILVIASVLEEFRGLGIRGEVAALASAPNVKAELQALVEQNADLPTVHTSLQPVLGSVASTDGVTMRSSHPSYARRLEEQLQGSADRISLLARRDDFRGQVALGYHEWRNRLLGITSASVRRVPDSAYRASLEMIELALRYAKAANVKVVIYLAPIRPIQPNPNLPSDVARFRHDVPELCKRYGVTCLDYIDLVPEQLWTNYPDDAVGTEGQRDYAHFTGAAHKLLAEKLMADVGDFLKTSKSEGALAQR